MTLLAAQSTNVNPPCSITNTAHGLCGHPAVMNTYSEINPGLVMVTIETHCIKPYKTAVLYIYIVLLIYTLITHY